MQSEQKLAPLHILDLFARVDIALPDLDQKDPASCERAGCCTRYFVKRLHLGPEQCIQHDRQIDRTQGATDSSYDQTKNSCCARRRISSRFQLTRTRFFVDLWNAVHGLGRWNDLLRKMMG